MIFLVSRPSRRVLCALALGAACLTPVAGHGQATTTTGMPGTCSGSLAGGDGQMHMISGKVYLLVNGRQVTPTTGNAGGIFGKAECECATNDIQLRVIMASTGVVPLGPNAGASMFLGKVDCIDQATRTNPASSCQQVGNIDYTAFEHSQPPIDIPLPASILSSPLSQQDIANHTQPTCSMINQANYVNIILGPTSSPATCSISLPINTIPAVGPTNVNVQPGDGALNVSFNVQAGSGIDRYQILCRDLGGPSSDMGRSPPDPSCQPSQFTEANNLYYSACINKTIHRRIDIPGTTGTPITPTPTVDMATAKSMGGTIQALRAHGKVPLPGPEDVDMSLATDGGTGDMSLATDGGTGDMSGVDLLVSGVCGSASQLQRADPARLVDADEAAFEALDPRFLCSDGLRSSDLNPTFRVDGLCNGHVYAVKLVAIDTFGNPTVAPTCGGVPTPALNLIEALYTDGNQAGGFGCNAATGATATGGMVPLLALLYALRLRRARRAAARGEVE